YSGVERPASQFLSDWLGERGFDAGVDRSDSAYARRGDQDGVQIVLLGHIDTVPGVIPVRVDEKNVLHGRGSVDAKGPLCAFACAAANAELPEGVEIVVLGCTEEEAETSRGSRHALSQYTPDAVVIGEPSGWDGVTLGYKGRMLARFELNRPWAHSAGPAGSATDAGLAWWSAVTAYVDGFNRNKSGAFTSLQATIHEIQSFNNGLTDSIRLHAGFRLPPSLTPEELERSLRESLADTPELHEEGVQASLHCSGRELAHRSSRSDVVATAFRGAIRVLGGKPIDKVKTGTSDMNVVAPQWNCPIIAYGPGDSSLDHTPEERQDLNEYWKSIEVLTLAIEQLAYTLMANQRTHAST
ncbi:MAG: [LysW]-lysine hydrolase, partial [Planctomycetota bacterium]